MIPMVELGSSSAPRDIRDACEGIGFFYLRDHGVPDAIRSGALAAAQRFFAFPEEAKLEARVDARHRGYVGVGEATLSTDADADFKESFVWGLERELDPARPLEGPNRWPADEPHVRAALEAYLEALMASGMTLLRAFAESLELSPDFFDVRYRRSLARGSLIHYPPCETRRFGTSPHTDYGCITLLWQDDVGGLQVEQEPGSWVDVPPAPETLVVNIGDLLARWTRGRFRSTTHRVLSHPARHRYSMAVFLDPDYDAEVDGVRCGDYIRSRFDDVFAYRSRT